LLESVYTQFSRHFLHMEARNAEFALPA